MKDRLLVVSTAVFLLLSAVSAQAASKDACSFLTPPEAQAALALPVGPARSEDRSSGAGQGSSCRYRATSGRALSGKTVSLNVRYSETDLTGSAEAIGENLKSAGFKNVHDVAGIGSAAIWGSNSILGRPQGELTVIVGKSVMLIVILDGIANEEDALARAKKIAARAIGRL
ncbi:hypothetical protein [Granulicella aggregans]|jgi:hypothetical protein|uniref:hypothetical protein n=1 Tax=Granulicella aggregans TaxID=474949 RepID=UPI0021DF7491|nr:hypothetical protein [Granulicella aggregans]